MRNLQILPQIHQDCLSKQYTVRQLAEKYNVDYTCVRNWMNKGLIPKVYKSRTPIVNDFYFNQIDTIDKAYFLGLLYADGCVHNSVSNEKVLILGLTDSLVIDNFKKYIQSESKIYKKIYKNPNYKNHYTIKIKSSKIFDDLINLGCVEKKSLILQFPTENQVPYYLLNHFIRGYFDGDGSIYIKNYEKACVSFAGTKHFLEGVQKILKENANINSKVVLRGNIYILSFAGTNQILKMKSYLYENKSDLFLERKFERFEVIEKTQQEKINKKLLKKII